MADETGNYEFLSQPEPALYRLAVLSERFLAADPNTSLIKARQFGEAVAKQIAARSARRDLSFERQVDLINALRADGILPRVVADSLHLLRKRGNKAAHSAEGATSEALGCLRFVQQIGAWYVRAYHGPADFEAPTFVPPRPPQEVAARSEALRMRLAELESRLTAAERKRAAGVARARAARDDGREWEAVAQENEAENAALKARLAELEADAARAPPMPTASQTAGRAAERIELDEQDTRDLIDLALEDAGWEADSRTLRHAAGTRPEPGRSRAIAEWPTASGPADYALFDGETLLATIEAKRQTRDVSGSLDQAMRYARDATLEIGAMTPGAPYPGVLADDYDARFRAPFAFATNGRPFVKELEAKSGIWFRDLRRAEELARPLTGWFSPRDLREKLAQSAPPASGFAEALAPGLGLWPHQRRAVEAVEDAVSRGRREVLVSMATGTGKTRAAIALMYRALKSKAARRVLFLVDRTSLAEQTIDALNDARVEGTLTFSEVYSVAGPEIAVPEEETRVHVATVQSLVARVLGAKPGGLTPGAYDLIIVDEAHRGYALDAELREEDLGFRSTEDYLSKYRRVLEHFDAVRVALTATPALQTTQIFGFPVYRYGYREAVIDGILIDHEPPKRLLTALNQAGISFAGGEEVDIIDPDTGEVTRDEMPDRVDFDVAAFNKRVHTPAFNRVVAETIAREIGMTAPGKTLIFAARDDHADTLVHELSRALEAEHGPIHADTVQKITGASDDPKGRIRAFRNESRPKFAVTVDLLTTGVDVPAITNLVFVRRVNSRILYDQMIGRATRRCPEIGKEAFRIFDAVDLYASLQSVTDMRPVVVDPKVSFRQLTEDLARAPGEAERARVRDQLVVKLRRRIRSLTEHQAEAVETETGIAPDALPDAIRAMSPAEAATFVTEHPRLAETLDQPPARPERPGVPIAGHEDELLAIEDVFKDGLAPEDYIEAFARHLSENTNAVAGLIAATTAPRELSRASLKALRAALDTEGFSETALRAAYGRARNADIAASILGFVRQAALGDPLVPYERRVDNAVREIALGADWTPDQKAWLSRIAKALKDWPVADKETFAAPALRQHGGYRRADEAFDGRLNEVLVSINEAAWPPLIPLEPMAGDAA